MGLNAALATLNAGTLFLGAGLGDTPDPGERRAIEGRYRAKVIGNGLRELDRFLSIAIDEAATLIAPDLDLSRTRNTANKLRTFRIATGATSPEHDRLRAIGRSRDCLFHCGGIVQRGDRRGGALMTAGWPPSDADSASPGRVLAIGDRLSVAPIDLDRVCRFYDAIADALAAQVASIDFPRRSVYTELANVAYDGI
jgi:hypothetical protein